MVTGSVTPDGGEAVISLRLTSPRYLSDEAGDEQRSQDVEAVVDSGFTGTLSLPPEVASYLGLSLRRSARFTLADGSVVALPVYRVGVVWHGRERQVRAYASPGGALVGMGLLRGSRLTVDAVPGGAVRIEEL